MEIISKLNKFLDKSYGKNDFVLDSLLKTPAFNNDLFQISENQE